MNCQEILLKNQKIVISFWKGESNVFSLILLATWPQTNYSLSKNKPLLGGKH